MYNLQAHLLGGHVSAWDYLRSHLAVTSGGHIRRSHSGNAQRVTIRRSPTLR
ncbi:hypothetical protein GGP98_003309 [Salinibacter ruber]|nr:hypothetical protein [Salinibacter ruber]